MVSGKSSWRLPKPLKLLFRKARSSFVTPGEKRALSSLDRDSSSLDRDTSSLDRDTSSLDRDTSSSDRDRSKQVSPQARRDYTSGPKSRAAWNALRFSLETLSSVSSNIPIGAGLSSIIDPLLVVMSRIEQTSANAQGFMELAARIELLTPIISETTNPSSRFVVEALRQELQSIKRDLDSAGSLGKMERFIHSNADAACLAKHNMNLAQIISTATLSNVHEVSIALKRLESKLGHVNEAQPIDISGGFGGMGGYGRFGGQGGDGEGPQLSLDFDESHKFGKISGGTGGAGGIGLEIGGKGGTGKGPVISGLRRGNLFVLPQPA